MLFHMAVQYHLTAWQKVIIQYQLTILELINNIISLDFLFANTTITQSTNGQYKASNLHIKW